MARLETVILLIALAAQGGWEIHHMDMKTAFLNGDLVEEVYVSQPPGYEKKGEKKKYCGCTKRSTVYDKLPRHGTQSLIDPLSC